MKLEQYVSSVAVIELIECCDACVFAGIVANICTWNVDDNKPAPAPAHVDSRCRRRCHLGSQ